MRIFFGATLPEATKREIVELQEMLRPLVPNARFEGTDKLHITLHFIGDFRQEQVGHLFSGAVQELRNYPAKSPSTEIVGMNYFPNEEVRRGIWLDCADDGSLASFASALVIASAKFGIIPEARAFKPHITIARLRERGEPRTAGSGFPGSARAAADLQKFKGQGKLSVERFFPKSVALFESILKPSGSEYRVLYEYSLE
ncbi:MAG TPA: RNA 2',3'-cyclic phosphodiesterase [Candidatus Kryptobacter bacterium]|nr:RNA 2',3'-cyclic phosphodiesterase [Candidatus Kryptobacter bacterium]